MDIAITGSRGLVGTKLSSFLTADGHRVTRVVRGRSEGSDVNWDPAADRFDAVGIDGVDAVVHLAGENIASRRWSDRQRRRIRESRVKGTRVLCMGLARMQSPPKVLVAASAIGIYGHRGKEILNENSPTGHGFLADVCRDWESATAPAQWAGIRVVNLRIGVVLSPQGGALAKMLLPFRLGFGGVIGSGQQFWSWIGIDDVIGAINQSLVDDSLTGPINAASPNPVTNLAFTKTLGRVLSRPTVLPIPSFAARLALGQLANDLLLASTRVLPERLEGAGYNFQHAELEGALRHVLNT